jgi:hypothetical protein
MVALVLPYFTRFNRAIAFLVFSKASLTLIIEFCLFIGFPFWMF